MTELQSVWLGLRGFESLGTMTDSLKLRIPIDRQVIIYYQENDATRRNKLTIDLFAVIDLF